MIRFSHEETRTSLECIDILKNDDWLKKAALILYAEPGKEITLFSDSTATIILRKTASITISKEPLFCFILRTDHSEKISSLFEIYRFEDEYSYSFALESVRTAAYVHIYVKNLGRYEADILSLKVKQRMKIPFESFDDVEILVERDSNNSFFFIKKVYSICTFTYQSDKFEIV